MDEAAFAEPVASGLNAPAAPQSALSPSGVPVLTEAMLVALDKPGPRYTSYPTADRFVEAFDSTAYAQALRQRRDGVGPGAERPLSLYVHIPFCEQLCYYCACNKIITKHHARAQPYLQALEAEIRMHTGILGRSQPLAEVHLGGGSPTFLSDAELSLLMAMLRSAFRFAPEAEVSIEVDPRTATSARIAHLKALGFNRLSFGVQDTDPAVQQAVHRVQSDEQVESLVHAARELQFKSVNVDLIYGLPKQTPESFARTLARIGQWRPDRIALYAYAHLPQRFKPQRRIDAYQLPTPHDRVQMLGAALQAFQAQGYDYIGMDHFALPQDSLAIAKREGRLHRNFQGYSTQPDGDQIGLGVSAIGRVGATYSQNAKTVEEYEDALKQGEFPVVRGLTLTRDDVIRRSAIMTLMCQGRLEFAPFGEAHLIDFPSMFAAELRELASLRDLGLVELEANAIQVTPLGWYFVRGVAVTFDRHLRGDQQRERFSKII